MRTVREVGCGDALNRVLNTELSSGFDHSTSQKLVFKVTVIISKFTANAFPAEQPFPAHLQ